MSGGPSRGRQRIIGVTLDERGLRSATREIEHERRVAIYDLVEENHFAPVGTDAGPYHLHIAVEDARLVIHIRDSNERPLDKVVLPVRPFRGLIKDYFTVCESYYEAIKWAAPSRIEAIDVGRRSLHDDGAELLRELLADEVDVDLDTARRLFTLLCVLHIRR